MNLAVMAFDAMTARFKLHIFETTKVIQITFPLLSETHARNQAESTGLTHSVGKTSSAVSLAIK